MHQTITVQQRGPWTPKCRGSHDRDFRRSIAWLSDSLSTLRSADYSNTTQDSLPVAGQALLDGLSTRKVPMKGFKVVDYISSSFPKLPWRKGRVLSHLGRGNGVRAIRPRIRSFSDANLVEHVSSRSHVRYCHLVIQDAENSLMGPDYGSAAAPTRSGSTIDVCADGGSHRAKASPPSVNLLRLFVRSYYSSVYSYS